MNERIKELLTQAGYKPLPGFDFANSLEEVFLQKFAKLIVQECINKVRSRQMFGENGCNIYHSFDLLVYDLESHFGVE